MYFQPCHSQSLALLTFFTILHTFYLFLKKNYVFIQEYHSKFSTTVQKMVSFPSQFSEIFFCLLPFPSAPWQRWILSVYFEIGGRRRRRRRTRRWTRPRLPSRSTSAYTSNSPTPPTSCWPSPCPPSASPSPPPARPLPAASRPASPPPTTPPSRAWTSPWPSATPASRPTRRRRTRGRSRRTASAPRKRLFL